MTGALTKPPATVQTVELVAVENALILAIPIVMVVVENAQIPAILVVMVVLSAMILAIEII